MPTYGPDGSIELDTTMHTDTGPTPHGIDGGQTIHNYRDSYFRDEMADIDGLRADRGYEHYEPAFRYGWESAERHRGRSWDDSEPELQQSWRERHSDRDWAEYRHAVKHAFERAVETWHG